MSEADVLFLNAVHLPLVWNWDALCCLYVKHKDALWETHKLNVYLCKMAQM